jgi:hypothetical protein
MANRSSTKPATPILRGNGVAIAVGTRKAIAGPPGGVLVTIVERDGTSGYQTHHYFMFH